MLNKLKEQLSNHVLKGKNFQRLIVSISSVLILFFVMSLAQSINLPGFIESLELKTYDLRVFFQQGQFANQPSKDIVILKFDDPTLNNFESEYGTWPWNRQVHADMMDWLSGIGTRALVYDLMFAFHKKGEARKGDDALIHSFKKHDNVYIGMNLDNNLNVLEYLNKAPSTQQFKQLQALRIQVEPSFSETNISTLPFGYSTKRKFFNAPYLGFNNFRPILPGLQNTAERIALVNHIRDVDGISRHNPVLFALEWTEPNISLNKPYHFKEGVPWYDQNSKKHSGRWYDSKNEWITEKGCIITLSNGYPTCSGKGHYDLYPYMGLRLALDLTFGKEQPHIGTLSSNGVLSFGNGEISIPIGSNGMLPIKWYNINVDRERIMQNITSLETYQQNLPDSRKAEQLKISKTLSTLYQELSKPYGPKPYTEISAWKVIQAIKAENNNEPNAAALKKSLKKYLKDKIVFIGTTAVSTFDIKTTPIASTLPGVIIQATVFDNIMQQKGFVERLPLQYNLLITLLLSTLCAIIIIRSRSAWLGFFSVIGFVVAYIIGVTLIFFKWSIWINIAAPLFAVIFITTMTYMVKYISRDRAYEKTYKLATTDAMTGLKNHRFFQEHMVQSIERANRNEHPFSLLLIDIDFFKKFNDTYGHQAGDRVLIAVAKKLEETVRKVDLVARYGGEEMTIVLENVGVDEALKIADKVVKAIAEEPYPIADGVSKHVTISVGVSTYPTHGLTSSALIEFSDKGLYLAKENGRNQVGFLGDNVSPESQASDKAD